MKVIEWEDIPDYGELLTIKEFISCVECGGFIDYDGFGRYATQHRMSDQNVRPSEIKKGKIRDKEGFSHVMWFNR